MKTLMITLTVLASSLSVIAAPTFSIDNCTVKNKRGNIVKDAKVSLKNSLREADDCPQVIIEEKEYENARVIKTRKNFHYLKTQFEGDETLLCVYEGPSGYANEIKCSTNN